MKVYALVFTIGIDSGSETLLGLFSTSEKAEAVKMKHSKNCGYALHHYEITELELDDIIERINSNTIVLKQ